MLNRGIGWGQHCTAVVLVSGPAKVRMRMRIQGHELEASCRCTAHGVFDVRSCLASSSKASVCRSVSELPYDQ